MSKFKVGDLVTLSAAGKARNGNWSVRHGFGIVIEIKGGTCYERWPVICHWPKHENASKKHSFKDYELKKLKVKKRPL